MITAALFFEKREIGDDCIGNYFHNQEMKDCGGMFFIFRKNFEISLNLIFETFKLFFFGEDIY